METPSAVSPEADCAAQGRSMAHTAAPNGHRTRLLGPVDDQHDRALVQFVDARLGGGVVRLRDGLELNVFVAHESVGGLYLVYAVAGFGDAGTARHQQHQLQQSGHRRMSARSAAGWTAPRVCTCTAAWPAPRKACRWGSWTRSAGCETRPSSANPPKGRSHGSTTAAPDLKIAVRAQRKRRSARASTTKTGRLGIM